VKEPVNLSANPALYSELVNKTVWYWSKLRFKTFGYVKTTKQFIDRNARFNFECKIYLSFLLKIDGIGAGLTEW
jgi:hypothetical protein